MWCLRSIGVTLDVVSAALQPRVICPLLVGREDEVRTLVECGTGLVDSQSKWALVSGRAGMGKTRLPPIVTSDPQIVGYDVEVVAAREPRRPGVRLYLT